MRRGGRAALVACALLTGAGTALAQEPPPSGAEPAAEGFRPRLVREGTLSLGGQGQYGGLVARTGFGRQYELGPGLAVRVRYRTGRESAFGISFEDQRFNAREDPVAPLDPDHLRGTVTTLEYYQFFRVRQRAPRYLMLGAGLLQTRRNLNNGEREFPGDAGVLTLGAGTEVWWKRWVSVDLSLRYYGFMRSEGSRFQVSHGVQAAGGLHFYTSR